MTHNPLWTPPRDWSVGEVVTAAEMNAHVRDNLKASTHWYDKDLSTVLASDTAAETELYSATISGGDMGTDRAIEFELYGDYDTNGLGDSYTFRIYLGSVVLIADVCTPGSGSGGLSSARNGWRLTGTVQNRDASNDQYTAGQLLMTREGASSPVNGQGGWNGSAVGNGGILVGEDTVDTTIDQVFKVTVQMSSASANLDIKKTVAKLKLV